MSYVLLVLCLLLLQTAALEDHTQVKVKPGQEAALQCSSPRDAAITLLEWSRHETKSDCFIFYRNSYERYQNESFKGRLELKDGDLTLILKNVTISDTGTYKCRLRFRNMSSRLFNEFKCFLNLTVTASDHTEDKVRPGQNGTLQCRGPRDSEITLLEWIRPEISSEGYVFFYRNKRPYEKYQHESFKGRVELRDPSMKDGDVSVIVRNVSIRDTGTYECVITSSSIRGGERVISGFKDFISLTVTDSGFTDQDTKDGGGKDVGGSIWSFSLITALSVCVVLTVVAVVGVAAAVVIIKRVQRNVLRNSFNRA